MTSVDESAARIVADLAGATQDPSVLEAGNIYAWLTPAGQVQKIDLTGDEHLDFPRRKRGVVTVRNVASFKQYWDKHHDSDSEVYANLDAGTVTAILDAHRGSDDEPELAARWQQHHLVLSLQLTQPWKDWTGSDRKWMLQEAFAEFLEEHARDIDPGGAVTAMDLFESAQDFKAKLRVSVTSGKRVRDGQTQFEYVEQVESAGRSAGKGTIDMPSEFDLAIRPYDDAPAGPVAVRLRYRIRDDKSLALGYFMNDPARVAREAVAEVVAKLEAECSVTVMHGSPA
jgi:uncharacterized protein YfdQ (DUF2303 family)